MPSTGFSFEEENLSLHVITVNVFPRKKNGAHFALSKAQTQPERFIHSPSIPIVRFDENSAIQSFDVHPPPTPRTTSEAEPEIAEEEFHSLIVPIITVPKRWDMSWS